MTLRTELATEREWADVRTAFGPRAGKPDSCWCQRFRHHDHATNEDALQAELRDSPVPIGVLAYVDDQPVGWTRVVPRHTLPGITGNAALTRVLEEDPAAWWVTCVNLRREARGRGVGTALLRVAIDHARVNGASVLDGHPVDVTMSATRPSPSALFTGTVSMFTAAGFREIGRTYPSRPVMRANLG
ncbi:GNAT family N-acetyltransferase [Rathayibacter caricis DSM 15933]|uniref:GNAT family N-acetyltransferase n=1 Tax=Rathayibacter caricis DSM 15933 TaxID=1328867 RepID=A0A2T4UP06_9MICO|nr:GNAT family N-acetyltransferase [Rathayibacter caricis]PTL71241.1 GNAT family N-acetyltransferase [Rathayibacter caricis DSM 15933]